MTKPTYTPAQQKLRNLSKRANNEIRRIEQTGEHIRSLQVAENYLENRRFIERTSKLSETQIQQETENIRKFLNSIKQEKADYRRVKQQAIEASKAINREKVRPLTKQEKQLQDLSRKANARLERIKNQNLTSKATESLQKQGINKFITNPRNLTQEQLKKQLSQVKKFLASNVSTVRDIKKANRLKLENLKNKFKLSNRQLDIFFQLMIRDKYKNLHRLLTSDQILENIQENSEDENSITQLEKIITDNAITTDEFELARQLGFKTTAINPRQPRIASKDIL